MAARDDEPGLSRREATRLLAVGGAASVVSWLAHDAGLAAYALQAGASRPAVPFPRGAVIRTLLKDIPPESLGGGPILFHEHLSISLSPNAPRDMADVSMMAGEAKAAARDGVACIVDGGDADMGRDLDALRRIASKSGLPIVASGGYYLQRTYPADIAAKTVNQIADDLVGEATEGRLGAFGEIGPQCGVPTADERKVFQAIARAQGRTRLPVWTHNGHTGKRRVQPPVPRDAALRQLDILEAGGARFENLAIGHVCCLDDPKAEIAIQLAKRGVFVGFDRVALPTMPDADRVVMVMAMAEAGVADRLLLSSDFYSETALKKDGGPGLAQTATVFGPMLIKAGMSETALRGILIDNPRRFLAFTPK